MTILLDIAKLLEQFPNLRTGHCWPNVQKSITDEDIRRQVTKYQANPKAFKDPSKRSGDIFTRKRIDHVRSIAYFVSEGWSEPIWVDLGIPSQGFLPEWPVDDGNHRLRAAIFRKDKCIMASVCGEVNFIEQFRYQE